jgi:hypothetical protein
MTDANDRPSPGASRHPLPASGARGHHPEPAPEPESEPGVGERSDYVPPPPGSGNFPVRRTRERGFARDAMKFEDEVREVGKGMVARSRSYAVSRATEEPRNDLSAPLF